MNTIDIEIDIRDIKSFVQFFKEKYAYDFSDYALSSFKRRLQRLLHINQLKELAELQKKIISNEIHFEKVVEEITVNTTEMFRDPGFWKKLKDTVVPNILKEKQGRIKIWHAACSSGEEVYSMAIVLKELGVLEKAEIIATDINEEVMQRAKRGIYSKQTLQVNTANYKSYSNDALPDFNQYYHENDEYTIQLERSLISGVKFQRFDLVKGSAFDSFDLILLRNVMIYFNFELQEKVTELVYSSLNNNGILALGTKETISWTKASENFTLKDPEDKIYRKNIRN
ncbi:MAG: protein-glutamate O-methyltransferase CheR [Bacteroidota bacterium]|nr:protein-glutamate O-methyltransferase CheR [Bacteroidota bacterium]